MTWNEHTVALFETSLQNILVNFLQKWKVIVNIEKINACWRHIWLCIIVGANVQVLVKNWGDQSNSDLAVKLANKVLMKVHTGLINYNLVRLDGQLDSSIARKIVKRPFLNLCLEGLRK